jgi:hypothetical protein
MYSKVMHKGRVEKNLRRIRYLPFRSQSRIKRSTGRKIQFIIFSFLELRSKFTLPINMKNEILYALITCGAFHYEKRIKFQVFEYLVL